MKKSNEEKTIELLKDIRKSEKSKINGHYYYRSILLSDKIDDLYNNIESIRRKLFG